ncbi:hypothetical protein LCGC14_1513160 [marine sediment metagenome]|uniref:Uncharacterized protein n=1 Tax=marine sediment metagenome TaxID=412755 RepID=A0A0F9M203_9ZZZZ
MEARGKLTGHRINISLTKQGIWLCEWCQITWHEKDAWSGSQCPGPARPRCCPDLNCELLLVSAHDDSDVGSSFDCYGKIDERRWVVDEHSHNNDISHCTYTPFKGTIRFFENQGDQELLVRRLIKLLALLGTDKFNMWWYFSEAVTATGKKLGHEPTSSSVIVTLKEEKQE